MSHQYAIRSGPNDLWEVFDIKDGEVVLVEGVPLVNLQSDEAVDAVELLKTGFVIPSKLPKVG